MVQSLNFLNSSQVLNQGERSYPKLQVGLGWLRRGFLQVRGNLDIKASFNQISNAINFPTDRHSQSRLTTGPINLHGESSLQTTLVPFRDQSPPSNPQDFV